MNRIDTLQVIDPAIQQPWTTKSLDFLQDSVISTVSNSVQGLAYGQTHGTDAIVLYGMQPGITSGMITAGAFYGGSSHPEIYTFPGGSLSGMAHPTLVPHFTNDPVADPITFSDGSSRSVHLIRNYIFQDYAIGTAPANSFLFSSLKYPNLPVADVVVPPGYWDGDIYCIKVNNVVFLKGKIQCAIGSGAGPRPAFPSCALPAGYLPGAIKTFSVPYITDGGLFATTIFQIAANGVITIPGGLQDDLHGFGNYFYFDGLSFYSDSYTAW